MSSSQALSVLLVLTCLLAANAQAVTIEGVPFVPQATGYYCGPAALSSVFAYYGVSIDQQTIAEKVYDERIKGALFTDLQDFAHTHGFSAQLRLGTVDDIKAYLDDGRPVIVLVDLGFWVFSQSHYLVVTGYTAQGFIAHNGLKASQTFGYLTFIRIWKRKGSHLLVVSPSPATSS